jgi:hypothetical protein
MTTGAIIMEPQRCRGRSRSAALPITSAGPDSCAGLRRYTNAMMARSRRSIDPKPSVGYTMAVVKTGTEVQAMRLASVTYPGASNGQSGRREVRCADPECLTQSRKAAKRRQRRGSVGTARSNRGRKRCQEPLLVPGASASALPACCSLPVRHLLSVSKGVTACPEPVEGLRVTLRLGCLPCARMPAVRRERARPRFCGLFTESRAV